MTYLLVSVFALCLMILLMPLLQRLALHIGAVDLPGARKVHQVPIPRIGGVLIGFSILLSLLVFAPLAKDLRALMAGSMVIAGLGLTDDLMGVKAMYKFGAQWLVAGLFLAMVRPDFSAVLPLANWLALPLASFFLVGLVNAINLQDGLDGLAAGQVVISAVCMGIYLLYSGQWVLVLVLATTVSAVLGFLRVNTWPASIFMGDSGSYLLGFLLAGVFLLGLRAGALPWWSGFGFFLLPILDTTQVILGRLFSGTPVFRADRRHLHHRLLDAGLAHQDVVYLEYMLSTLAALVPLLWISPLRLRWGAFLLVGLLCGAFILQQYTARVGRSVHGDRQRSWFRPGKWAGIVARWWFLASFSAIYLVQLTTIRGIASSAGRTHHQGLKYGLLPVLLTLFYTGWSAIRLRQDQQARVSTSLSLLAATELFIYHQFGPRGGGFPDWTLVHLGLWLALLASGVLLFVVRFRDLLVIENPLDYLLAFLAIALFFLPVELKGSFRTDYLAIELLCFFLVLRVITHVFRVDTFKRMLPLAGLGLVLLFLVGWVRG